MHGCCVWLIYYATSLHCALILFVPASCLKNLPEGPSCCLRYLHVPCVLPTQRQSLKVLWLGTKFDLCCLAVKQNFNVVRIFGFPVQMGFNLQTAPGRYNEYAFTGLDRVIAEAGKAGLKLVVALTNNWNYNSEQTDWK